MLKLYRTEYIGEPQIVEEGLTFIGYCEAEGSSWVLVFTDEEGANKLIEEFKATGKLTLNLNYGRSSEVISPIAVSKFTSNSMYCKKPVTVEVNEGGEGEQS